MRIGVLKIKQWFTNQHVGMQMRGHEEHRNQPLIDIIHQMVGDFVILIHWKKQWLLLFYCQIGS